MLNEGVLETKALILIGGSSSRMGTDKYLMNPNGKPQYLHLYEMISSLGLEVYLSCSNAQKNQLPEGMPKIGDTKENTGPMGGLYAAIESDDKCSWLVVACDLIHLHQRCINDLLPFNSDPCDIVTYRKEGSNFLETTISVYHPSSFSEVCESFHSGAYSLQRVLKKSRVKTLVPHDERVLTNANYPSDVG